MLLPYIYNDYQIIIKVTMRLAWQHNHKQRLNDLRTQLGEWNSYFTISANEAKNTRVGATTNMA